MALLINQTIYFSAICMYFFSVIVVEMTLFVCLFSKCQEPGSMRSSDRVPFKPLSSAFNGIVLYESPQPSDLEPYSSPSSLFHAFLFTVRGPSTETTYFSQFSITSNYVT